MMHTSSPTEKPKMKESISPTGKPNKPRISGSLSPIAKPKAMQTSSPIENPKGHAAKLKLSGSISPISKPKDMPNILFTSSPTEITKALRTSFLNLDLSAIILSKSLEAMSDTELLRTNHDLQRDLDMLDAENNCFNKFLYRINPNAVLDPETYLGIDAAKITPVQYLEDSGLGEEPEEQVEELLEVVPETTTVISEKPSTEPEAPAEKIEMMKVEPSIISMKSSTSHVFQDYLYPLVSISDLENVPRINVAHKTELIDKEIEELKNMAADYMAKAEMKAATLKAQIEEIDIRTVEIREAREQFEKVVVIDGVDIVTQRIPAEKFIHYMEDWLKRVGQAIEKLRLRTGTMRSQYTRLYHQFALKEELGESLRPIDFEQLTIENKDHSNMIEEKNVHLFGLKRVTGIASLTLSVQKKNLIEAMKNLKQVESSILDTKALIADMEKEEIEAENEAILASEELEKLKEITRDYSAPGVMEYVRKKAELHKLEEEMKIWIRKRSVQQIALNSSCKQNKKCMQAV